MFRNLEKLTNPYYLCLRASNLLLVSGAASVSVQRLYLVELLYKRYVLETPFLALTPLRLILHTLVNSISTLDVFYVMENFD
jgi:hypothetical protein